MKFYYFCIQEATKRSYCQFFSAASIQITKLNPIRLHPPYCNGSLMIITIKINIHVVNKR